MLIGYGLVNCIQLETDEFAHKYVVQTFLRTKIIKVTIRDSEIWNNKSQ